MLESTVDTGTFVGGDGQSVFPVPFPFLDTGHIAAELVAADGTRRELRAGADFIVNSISDGNGEFILLQETVPEGGLLRLRRIVPLTQDVSFHRHGPLSPQAIENALDKLTMIAQQQDEAIARCLELPDGAAPGQLFDTIASLSERVGGLSVALDELRQEVRLKADGGHCHHDADGPNKERKTRRRHPGAETPLSESGAALFYLAASGVYHKSESCARSRGQWLDSEGILALHREPRPCGRCRPPLLKDE